MKKIVLIMSVVMMMNLSTAQANNPSGTCGVHCNWVFEDGTLKITGGANGVIGTMDNYTGAAPWFDEDLEIKYVSISGVKNIGDNAFAGTGTIQGIDFLDNNLESIGESAFLDTGISELILPNSLKTIGDFAFESNYHLSEVNLGDSLQSIGTQAFWDSPITSIIVPDTLSFIGNVESLGANLNKIICKGTEETCANVKELFSEYRYSNDFTTNLSTSDHFSLATEAQCTGNYGWTGKSCSRKDENGNVACASGYADYKNKCWEELPFSKKRWTPAEAAQWLNEDDNTVTITFKK